MFPNAVNGHMPFTAPPNYVTTSVKKRSHNAASSAADDLDLMFHSSSLEHKRQHHHHHPNSSSGGSGSSAHGIRAWLQSKSQKFTRHYHSQFGRSKSGKGSSASAATSSNSSPTSSASTLSTGGKSNSLVLNAVTDENTELGHTIFLKRFVLQRPRVVSLYPRMERICEEGDEVVSAVSNETPVPHNSPHMSAKNSSRVETIATGVAAVAPLEEEENVTISPESLIDDVLSSCCTIDSDHSSSAEQ